MVDVFAQALAWIQRVLTYTFGGYEEQLLSVTLYTIAIMFYAIIIWSLYRFLSKQDIFIFKGMEKAKVPTLVCLLLYLVIFPVITFVAFLFFTLLLIFLAKGQALEQILIISITLIAAIRLTAYYEEELSRDVAKLIPLALLAVFLVDPSYYSFEIVLERLVALPSMVPIVLRYLLFVVLLEWTLRILLRIRMRIHAPPTKE